MPQNRNSGDLPEAMTWMKALPVIAVSGLFDLMRMFFEMFWLFGPALAAAYCTLAASDTLSKYTLGLLGTKTAAAACSITAGAAGFAGIGPIETFGVVMAIGVGFAGWLAVSLLLLVTNSRVFKEPDTLLWLAGSLLVSEVPFIGTFPALTSVVVRLYSAQIKKEKKDLQRYATRLAETQKQEQRQAAQFIQTRTLQEQEAANDASYEQAANDAQYTQEEARAA